MKSVVFFLFTLFFSIALMAQSPNIRSDSRVMVGGTYYYVHKVKVGETLSSLARVYDIDQSVITSSNPHIDGIIKTGEVLKIPVEIRTVSVAPKFFSSKKATVHTINKGETAYSISKRYAISVESLIEANQGFDPLHISIGQTVLIPKQMIGSVTQTDIKKEFDQYKEALSILSPNLKHHLVEPKETLYSISKKYNIETDTLKKYNEKEITDGLKIGSIIVIPIKGDAFIDDVKSVTKNDRQLSSLFQNSGSSVAPKPINSSEPLNVVMVLPFKTDKGEEKNFVDFYNGALIALQDLKHEGVSVNLEVFNSSRSAEHTALLTDKKELRKADLIIGPVYNETFTPIAEFAGKHGIPIVSPLAAVDGSNKFVYQIAPNQSGKYTKLKQEIEGDYNIIMITPSSGVDNEFKNEIEKVLPHNIKHINYSKSGTSSAAFDNALTTEKPNIIVITSQNENITEEIMARISSLQNSVTARTGKAFRIKTIGSSRWAKFPNIDKELFFKLGVVYTSTYYADRSNKAILEFDREYLTNFGNLPTLYAYRGYDITKLFIFAINKYGENFANHINQTNTELLQVKYHFDQHADGKWVNNEWVIVKYRDDYIIDVK